jgi:prolyl-tRNA synthetase
MIILMYLLCIYSFFFYLSCLFTYFFIYISFVQDSEDVRTALPNRAKALFTALTAAGIRVKFDDRENYTPAWKYAHWEQKGVPLRVEIGPRDVVSSQAVAVRRDTGAKNTFSTSDTTAFATEIKSLLSTIQVDMLEKARAERDSQLSVVTEWNKFVPALDNRNIVLAPWCCRIACEEWVKDQTGPKAAALAAAAITASSEASASAASSADAEAAATEAAKGLTGAAKTLCIPMEQPDMPTDQACFCGCGEKAVSWTLWGRSY